RCGVVRRARDGGRGDRTAVGVRRFTARTDRRVRGGRGGAAGVVGAASGRGRGTRRRCSRPRPRGDAAPSARVGRSADVGADAQLAARLATEAGALLVELRSELFGRGAPSWQVMDNGDLVAHRFLMRELTTHRPDDAVLSEEGADDLRRLGADRVWIVDPLD